MALDHREPFVCADLINRVPANHRVMLVSNSTGFLTDEGWMHLSSRDNVQHTYAIEILNPKGEVRAAFGWSRRPRERTALTVGTWVHARLRRRGLAQAMWRAMIDLTKVRKIETFIVSDEGWTLVQSLKQQLGNRTRIVATGDWDLTDLRTGEIKKGTIRNGYAW